MTRPQPVPNQDLLRENPIGLPRKFTKIGGMDFENDRLSRADAELVRRAKESAHVHPFCSNLWKIGKEHRPMDTFIGVISRIDWTFYVAPCFGVTKLMRNLLWPDSLEADMAVQRGEIPFTYRDENGRFRDVTVKASATATEGDDRMFPVREIEMTYGARIACYVLLDDDNKFDGKSHKAMRIWIVSHSLDRSIELNQTLGFSIQRDKSGYYIRYASGLNERVGQNVVSKLATFKGANEHTAKYPARETRDLPKAWACFVESILARDLSLALLKPGGGKFDRIVSRDESQTTKISRFCAIPDLHLDRLHPGTIGTGNRVI